MQLNCMGDFCFNGLALSVTFGDTSPKGRGFDFPARLWALPLGELARQRLRGQGR